MAFLWRKTKGLCAGLVGPGLACSSRPPRQPYVCHRPRRPKPSPGESPPAPNRPCPRPHTPATSNIPPGTGGDAPVPAAPPRQRRPWLAAPRGAIQPCGRPRGTARLAAGGGEELFCCHVCMKWHLLDSRCPLQLPPEDRVPAAGLGTFSVCTGGPAGQTSKYSRQINNPLVLLHFMF